MMVIFISVVLLVSHALFLRNTTEDGNDENHNLDLRNRKTVFGEGRRTKKSNNKHIDII